MPATNQFRRNTVSILLTVNGVGVEERHLVRGLQQPEGGDSDTFATRLRDPGWSSARDPMHGRPKKLVRPFAPHRATGKRIPIPR
jgi:hypothetical protein